MTTFCMKCTNEVQFCFSAAQVSNTGAQLKLLEHARKKVVQYSKVDKQAQEEIKRVKSLTSY